MLDPNYGSSGLSQGDKGLVMPDQSKVNVMFFSKAKLMPFQSKEAGRQIWSNVDMVRVQQPGEKDPIVLEAHDGHKQRWRKEWEAYQAGRKAVPEGTPLTVLFPEGNEAGVLILNALGIYTIEQMAEVSDSVLGNIPFGGEMKLRAGKYVTAINGAQGFNKVQAELDKAKMQTSEMERRMEEMQDQMRQMQQVQPSTPGVDPSLVAALVAAEVARHKPGRKPKSQEA